MAYTINRYDGQQLTQVLDATINNATDLKLVGRNYAGYGEVQNENFVYLLENFSGDAAPENKIRGQLWFDTLEQKVKIYTGIRWKSIGFIENSDQEPLQFEGEIWNDTANKKLNFYDGDSFRTIAITQNSKETPSNLKEGDFWWNTETKQLFAYNGLDFDLIGPPRAGEEPTLMISELVKDTESNEQAIIRAVVDGESVFVISENEFEISDDTPVPGFSVVKKGITLINSESGRTKNQGTWFWGTASDADRLDGLTSTQFLRRDIDADTQGNIEFTNDETGIDWSNSSIKNTNASLKFQIEDDSQFEFAYTDSGTETSLLKISTEQGIDGLTFRGGKVWHSDNDGPSSGMNADLLDGEQGSYYLDWTNVTNKPDPTITITGDVTGSVTLTDVTGGTLAAVVQKDSHRHTISTIDNLQTELDSKLPASQYTAQDVFDKVKTLDGAGSGLNADLLDGLTSSQFLRANAKAVDSEKLDGLDSSAFLQRSGGTMSGQITLPGNATDENHAITKGYLEEQLELVGQAGEISYFAMQTPPDGWLKANGALVNRSTYARLFAAIGTQFGSTNSGNFRLPDLRGEFVRGWDDSRGVDSGRGFGSSQEAEFESHDHDMSSNGAHSHSASASNAGSHTHSGSTNTAGRHTHTLYGNDRGTFSGQQSAPGLYIDDAERAAQDNGSIRAAGDHSHSVSLNSAGDHSHDISVQTAGNHSHTIFETGGNETRPRNIALLACIRY